MGLLNKIEDKKFVKNALIVIIALFEDHGLDFPMKKGRDFKDISKQD